MESAQYFRLLIVTALIVSTTSTITYVCNPDNSIDVANLPSDYNYYAMQDVAAPGADVMCTVSDLNATAVTITGCTKDLDVLLTYSTYDGMDTNSIHGGKTVSAVKITCSEIPLSGNVHTVDNTFGASLTIDEETEVNPTYDVTSRLSTASTTVGTPVTWTIEFPVEYILEVTNCTAYAGTDDSSSESVSLITTGGCYVTDELISVFTDNLDGTATATIQAFKFYNEANVFLQCNLKVCPGTSSSCSTTCSRTKRSARDISGELPNDDPFYTKRVHNVLNVVDPDLGSGAMDVARFSITTTLTSLMIALITHG